MRVIAAFIGLALIGMAHAAPYQAGDVTVFVFERGEPALGVRVAVDGEAQGATDRSGAVDLSAGPGRHEITLTRAGTELARLLFSLDDNETAEISIALAGIGREARSQIETFGADEASGRISGVVRGPDGAPVPAATITVDGTDIVAQSAADGSFDIQLPRGVYDVQVAAPELRERRYTGVRALASVGGELELALSRPGPDTGDAIEEVVAIARYVPDTSLALERDAESVLDVITDQEISLAGDSTAAAALARVTGVTVQNDLVFVRGLGDRFSQTLLNNAELPSPDPARRAIGLDIFPTELVGGITVQKTYSPDLPGDFSGGAVRLSTRGVPDELTAKIKLSTGFNQRSTFQRGFTHEGSDLDFLGIDENGSREIPGAAAQLTNGGTRPLSDLSDAENEAVGEALAENFKFNLRGIDMPADTGIEASVGAPFRLGGIDFGINFAGFYDQDWRFRREDRAVVGAATGDGSLQVENQGVIERTDSDVATGAVAGLTAEINANNSIEYVSLLSRTTTKSTFFDQRSDISGGDDSEVREVNLEFIENQLLSNQISGSHVIPALRDLEVNWQAVYSQADRDEPGTRTYSYSRPIGSDEPFVLASGPGTGGLPPVFKWEELEDETTDLGLDFSLPARLSSNIEGNWKAGVRYTKRERDFDVVRWRLNLTAGAAANELFLQSLQLPSLEMILTPNRIGPDGFEVINATTPAPDGSNADNYDAEQDLIGGYLMGDFYIGERFRVQLGSRFEDSDIEVVSAALASGGSTQGRSKESDFLPALNLTWFVNDISQLRFGASRTVNRPQFRELSPALFRDPETRFETFGNPNLEQTSITSFDLRYERYVSGEEGFTFALFYKDFEDPIEIITRGGGQGGQGVRTFINSDSAELYGLELDGRINLDTVGALMPSLQADFLRDLYLAGNVALIESDVSIGRENQGILTNESRRLQGQSPYVINFRFGYSNALIGTDAVLLLNIFGERIDGLGVFGAPDAKEQPRPILDFNLTQRLFDNWLVGIKLRDILDSEFEVTQGDVVQRGFKDGRSLSVSLGYEF